MAVTLSLVMPVFNGAALAVEMMQSILANTFQDWELWAVDDGSEPAERQVLERFVQCDSRLHYLPRSRKPKGAQTCRNQGLALATGEFVCFFDADDRITPSCLARRVEALQARPDLDFMVFPSGIIRGGEFSIQPQPYLFGYPIYADDLEAFAQRRLPFVVVNNIYRTASLRKKHLRWDEALLSLHDADFNVQALLAGLRYAYASDAAPDYGYRLDANPGSLSRKEGTAVHIESHCYAARKYYAAYQRRFAHRYDEDLTLGVLSQCTSLLRGGCPPQLLLPLAQAVQPASPAFGRWLERRLRLQRLLQRLLPARLARRLCFASYLSDYRHHLRTLPHRIQNLQN